LIHIFLLDISIVLEELFRININEPEEKLLTKEKSFSKRHRKKQKYEHMTLHFLTCL
jgi:hypothetical protein